jgi:apolipoprotein N-acyltransferase
MFFIRKTKKQNILKAIWFPFFSIAVFIVAFALGGPAPAFYSLGVIYFFASTFPIAIVIKTQNTGYLAVALFQIFAALVCISAPAAIQDKSDIGLIPVFIVAMYVMMLVTGYQALNRKLRWRGEEIFELAALPVEDIGGSFTARPRPTGNNPVSKTEMIRFLDFLTRNLIAFAFKEENRVVFVLTLPGNDLPYIFGIKKDYLNDTWVAVDYDGNITVNITEEDYLLFKMDLDFDQICQSLGDVFSEFLTLSKEGKEDQIIDRMNALRLNPLG